MDVRMDTREPEIAPVSPPPKNVSTPFLMALNRIYQMKRSHIYSGTANINRVRARRRRNSMARQSRRQNRKG